VLTILAAYTARLIDDALVEVLEITDRLQGLPEQADAAFVYLAWCRWRS